jgi:hypothetical protein
LAASFALGACAGSPGPSGWQAVPGSPDAWTTGSGASQQRFTYEKKAFSGTLQDLTSQQTIDVLLHHRGSKFQRSDVFPACPGIAAIAFFSLGNGRTLEEGYAVEDGHAVLVGYDRPSAASPDAAAVTARERALCVKML